MKKDLTKKGEKNEEDFINDAFSYSINKYANIRRFKARRDNI